MSRIAIVGCEASGKTVLTASLADFFQPGKSQLSCSMIPENTAAHRFFEYTNYQMRAKHAWPQATNPDKTTVMRWSFRIDGAVVADLETLDFGGEVFRSAFREGEPTESGAAAQKELMDYLSASDFIVVTVSLRVLMRDLEISNDISATDFARDSEAKWVTRGILTFVRNNLPPQTGLVIALTQADLYYDELVQMGGPDGLFSKSWPTIAALYPDVPVVAVSAVSGVAEDGSPMEGYSSEGVLPLMSVFADYCVSGVDALRESLETTITTLRNAPEDFDPLLYRRHIQTYSDKVGMFRIASGLSGDYYNEELKKHIDALVSIEDVVAKKLRKLEAANLAKHKAREEQRKKEEEAARIAQEEKRKVEAALEEKRRKEDAKRLEDERIKAEKELEKRQLEAKVELEKRQLEAKVEFEKSRAAAKKNVSKALIVITVGLVIASGCGLYFLIDRSKRTAEVEAMKVQEMQRIAQVERLQKMSEAARIGDVASAQKILDMIEDGAVAESDVDGLYKIYMLMVNEGDPRAMYRLGVACHKGTCGVKKSDFNAHWFLSMAKKSGYAPAGLEDLLEETASAQDGDGQAQSQGIDMLFVSEEENRDQEPASPSETNDEDTANELDETKRSEL